MHPKERVLNLVSLYRQKGEPIPLDLLAQADELGLSVEELDEPITNNPDIDEGDNS